MDKPEHVDHDHRTGKVRGILCFNCNGGLGQFKDQSHVLRKAVDYLDRTTPRYVLVHPGVTQVRQPETPPTPRPAVDRTAALRLFAHLRTPVTPG